jgi:hypothetical protein
MRAALSRCSHATIYPVSVAGVIVHWRCSCAAYRTVDEKKEGIHMNRPPTGTVRLIEYRDSGSDLATEILHTVDDDYQLERLLIYLYRSHRGRLAFMKIVEKIKGKQV